MQISRLEFEILSAIFQFILGVILHYTYEWSNYNIFIGLYSSIDETILSHAGMIIIPSILFTNFIYIYYTFFQKIEVIIKKEENISLLEESNETIEVNQKVIIYKDVWFSRSFSLNISLIITQLLYKFWNDIFIINKWLNFLIHFIIILFGNLVSNFIANKINDTKLNTLIGVYINIIIFLFFLSLNMKKIIELN